jgi:hypothetical protein
VSGAVAVGVAAVFLVMSGDKTPLPDREKQKAVQESCAKPVYVRIGEHVFGIQRKKIYSISYKDQSINANCNTSLENPLDADKMSFSAKIYLSQNNDPYRIQYFVYLSSENKVFETIYEKIREKNKHLTDLPTEGRFFKYINEVNATYYIYYIVNPTDFKDTPFVVYNCNKNTGAFSCETAYLWESNIVVITRPNDQKENIPRAGSIDAWIDAFPIYLQTLRSALAKAPGGRP